MIILPENYCFHTHYFGKDKCYIVYIDISNCVTKINLEKKFGFVFVLAPQHKIKNIFFGKILTLHTEWNKHTSIPTISMYIFYLCYLHTNNQKHQHNISKRKGTI